MITRERLLKICGVVIGISGFVIIFSTLYPILSYEWESAQKYPTLISPLVDEEKATFKFSKTDYTKASNWFSGDGSDTDFNNNEVLFFTISIPKLGIDNASVAIGGEDLSDNLIQYPGTALPGKKGNAVIFGHSVLPQYFNPSNYLSIFSTLPDIHLLFVRFTEPSEVAVALANTPFALPISLCSVSYTLSPFLIAL